MTPPRGVPGRAARMAVAASAALTIAGAVASTAPAAAGVKPIRAVGISLPRNANPNPQGALFGADCVRAGSCAAGGTYVDKAGHSEPLVAAESGGRWARGVELRLPRNAHPDPFGAVNSVDCTRPGNCVAVGSYNGSALFQGFAATQSRGRWQRALLIAPPPNTARLTDFQLNSVACTGVGSCVAVGQYEDSSGRFEPLVVTESKGRWARARELALPPNAGSLPNSEFLSVACTGPGSCVATGNYDDTLGVSQVAVATQARGRWHQAIEIKLPKGAAASPMATPSAVTCAGAGFCVVVGHYQDTTQGVDSFAATRSARGWGRAIRVAVLPGNAAPRSNSQARSVGCTRAGFCLMPGAYFDKAGGFASMVAVQSRAKWTRAAELLPPGGAATGAARNSQVSSVSCTGSGYCVIVGSYRTTSGLQKPMAAKAPAP